MATIIESKSPELLKVNSFKQSKFRLIKICLELWFEIAIKP